MYGLPCLQIFGKMTPEDLVVSTLPLSPREIQKSRNPVLIFLSRLTWYGQPGDWSKNVSLSGLLTIGMPCRYTPLKRNDTAMAHITQDFFEFFSDLETHNNREWFQENKKRYETAVKEPFTDLVETLLGDIEQLDPSIAMNARDAQFRINRDVRFSKDKTPYNTMMKAAFAKDGRKSGNAGYYLGLGVDGLHVGGGIYDLDKERLEKIRYHIAANSDEFLALTGGKKFRDGFGEVQGERNKRLPSDLQALSEKIPALANKQFYCMAHITDRGKLVGKSLHDVIVKHFRLITPFNAFLNGAFEA